MAEAIGKGEIVTVEELAFSNAFEIAAMFNILERKGLISKPEFLEEVTRLHKEANKAGLQTSPEPHVVRD